MSPSPKLDIHLPNGNSISSTQSGILKTHSSLLPILAHVFPDHLLQQSLISVADYCNQGCTATLTQNAIQIHHKDILVASGIKEPNAKLWPIQLTDHSGYINAAVHHQHDAEFVQFVHASFGSPPISSFLKAIRAGYLGNYPRLTAAMVAKNPPVSMATAKGHLDLIRQGQHSTQPISSPPSSSSSEPCVVYTLALSEIRHSDLTGSLPFTSRHGCTAILVSVYNGYVYCVAMRGRSAPSYVDAYSKVLQHFQSLKIALPSIQRMDNETSTELEFFLHEHGLEIEYVPPANHRTNRAERAIRHVKNNLISMMAGTDRNCPVFLWDEFLPQLNITINIIRPCPMNPAISAYHGVHGAPYDFMRHPIAPCGIKVLVYESPEKRTSWAPHGVPGYYCGPALDAYRCFRVFVSTTSAMRISDTLAWFPENYIMPGASASELMVTALQDLNLAIAQLQSHPDTFLRASTATSLDKLASVNKSVHELVTLFSRPTMAADQRVVADAPVPDPPVCPSVAVPSVADQRVSDTSATIPTSLPLRRSPRLSGFAAMMLNLDDTGKPLTYRQAKSGPDSAHWLRAEVEEFDRLFASKTLIPILYRNIPLERRVDITYYNPQTKEKIGADGSKTYRIRGTAGGDRVNYPGDVSARTADMEVVKTLIHSVASDRLHGAMNWMTLDIKDFYLGTPLPRAEFIRIPLKMIPRATRVKHQLDQFIHRDTVLFEAQQCMYGLPQVGLLSQQRLVQHLATYGYVQDPVVPCLFKHTSRSVVFSLVVDDFGVKYQHRADAEHLIAILSELYLLHIDWDGAKYLGFHIKLDDAASTVSISMPDYVPKMLHRFSPGIILKGEASPAVYFPPRYGAHQQFADAPDDSPVLSSKELTKLQAIIGSVLFYARAVDYTMLEAVNHLASEQSHPTQAIMFKAMRLLGYAAAHPNHRLTFRACDMVLYIQSDASYLSRSQGRSVAGGICYFGNREEAEVVNGAVQVMSAIIPTVVSSVAEAEYAACFMNAQNGYWLRTIAASLGYAQGPTTIICDNACAVGLATDTIKIKRTKAIDMRYHWLRDRIRDKQFHIYWSKGSTNLADFFTKALPVYRFRELKRLIVAGSVDLTNPSLSKAVLRSTCLRQARRAAKQSLMHVQ